MHNETLNEKAIKVEILLPSDLTNNMSNSDIINMNALALLPYIKNDDITYGQAARFLGIERLDLIEFYGSLGIPYVDYDPKEIDDELETFNKIMGDKGGIEL